MAKNVSSNPQDHVHVRQRGNKWSYRFAKAKLDGKRKTEERGGFNTKDEALVAGVKAYELYMSGGRATQPTELSFGDFLDIWYERTKLYARNNTLEMREKNIRLHIKPALGEYRLASLRPALIDQFVKEKRKAGYSYEKVCRMLGNISTALEYAVWPMELLQSNPACRVKVPGKEFAPLSHRRPRRRIENDELSIIFKLHPFGDTYHMPIMLGLYFAARIGEALGVTWDCCDMEKMTLTIRQQIQRLSLRGHHSFHYLCDTKTEGSHRTLAFDAKIVLPLLKRWKQKQAENELFYGQDYYYNYLVPAKDFDGRDIQKVVSLEKAYPAPGKRIDFICTQPNGKYIKPCSMAYQCKRIRDAGVRDFDFHCLRHTSLTMLGEAQISPNDIMARAGHTDYDTTLQYIDRDRPSMQAAPVRAIVKELRRIKKLSSKMEDKGGRRTDGGQTDFTEDRKPSRA